MGNNRIAGVALLAVGLGWLAAWPAFLWWMVSMEASGGPDRPDEAAWRLWRALEILLVEPRWLAYTLAVLMLGASALGMALLALGIATLGGERPGAELGRGRDRIWDYLLSDRFRLPLGAPDARGERFRERGGGEGFRGPESGHSGGPGDWVR
jgi:hypothetical protein